MRRAKFLYLLVVAAAAQIQKPPPVPRKGSIEGIVSDAVSHEPLKKVQVVLNGPGFSLTAVTDAGGSFAFRELAAGQYWLSASKSGYNQGHSILSAEAASMIVLTADEQRKDVEVSLTPAGTISGRVVNEEGIPVRGCDVNAVELVIEQERRTLRGVAGGMVTKDRGEYRLTNLGPGRYYLFARCHVELPAPHPLLARGDLRTPHETYLPQFYGGGLDPSTSTKVALEAGVSLQDIDFRVSRVPAFTLRGSVSGSDPGALDAPVNIMLLPANRLMRNLTSSNATAESPGYKFQIQGVIPGSYLVFSFSHHESGTFTAERTVEVGASPPDPVELSLSKGSEVKGSVQFDCDDHPPLKNTQVFLAPLDAPSYVSQPRAIMDKDGAFTLTGAMPGRWRLTVSAEGYPKSVSFGGQSVSPYGFQIGLGAGGPLRITMGCKQAQVTVSVDDAPAGRQVFALLFPEDPAILGAGVERVGSSLGTGRIEFGALPPGRYRVFATDAPNPWPILERLDVLQALESKTVLIEVPEGGLASATLKLIPCEELMQVLEAVN